MAIKTNIDGVIVLKPSVYRDGRGIFMELYSQKKYFSHGITEKCVQQNYSHSKKNVLRGLHYQVKKPQGKIIQVINGTIFDVGVDIRRNSPTYGHSFSIQLDDKDYRQVYFPPGIAHGFCVVSEYADVVYQCTEFYDPDDENGVLWSDPALEIDWPITDPIISNRDQSYKKLCDISPKMLPISTL